MSYRRIALEEAFVTQDIADEWAKVLSHRNVEPGFRKMGESILAHTPGNQQLHNRLLDLGAGRLAHMDETGIDVQVLSLTSPGVQVFDAVTATRLAAESNEVLADAVRRHPTRFVGLAAVAPQYPAGAALEVERAAKRLGLSGLIINSHTMGEYLDDPKYWEILEAAEAADMPIYLHPREPAPSMVTPYLDYGLYFAGWGFAIECGLHAMRLIMSGVFDRFPRLRIILGHMGEGIPYWLKRIDNRYELQVKIGAVPKMARKPSEYFLEHFVVTTSGMTDPDILKLCLSQLGVERVLFAADYPYESIAEHVEFLDTAPVTEAERRAIYEDNACRVLKIAR